MQKNLSVYSAISFLGRLRGAIGSNLEMPLFLPQCSSIHTCFLQTPLYLIWIDDHGIVLEKNENVLPWRVCWKYQANGVIEFFPSQKSLYDDINVGDFLKLIIQKQF